MAGAEATYVDPRSLLKLYTCRSLDVLHVASALELGLRYFLTFDQRQRRLARAVGLKPLEAPVR